MQKDRIDFINTMECLNSSNIDYIIGGESLTGLNDGRPFIKDLHSETN